MISQSLPSDTIFYDNRTITSIWFEESTSMDNYILCSRLPRVRLEDNIRDCFDCAQIKDIKKEIREYASLFKIKEFYINNTMHTSHDCSDGLYFLSGKLKRTKLSLNIPILKNGNSIYINHGNMNRDSLKDLCIEEISSEEIDIFLNGPRKVPTARIYYK
jgi:hypothetical protein